ncbi:hypothetical protein U5922_009695 [Aquicoccus sp. G2-2]|jgi:hypothetical protein|uniref:hypothetical protein n=1 Tax=Aquicoccus sp. G2-2 TaxID=3092120 RepID=UPI002ADF55D0|nr:hypothetical protein [Aquicoccus sp. G2-2]MEA1113736.1 hypothetical protein [Aquicoccus sp. G2-2]
MLGGSNSFDRRVTVLKKAHRKGRKAYVPIAGPDGVVYVRKPQSKFANVPFRGLLLLALGLVLFKGLAIAQFGALGYDKRLGSLREGTIIEQAGAWVMQPDRVSLYLAGKVGPYLR